MNRPYQMVVRGNEGWVPAPRLHGSKISTRGQREGVESCLRLYGGGLCVGRTGTGMGPRMREDNGGGEFLLASSRGAGSAREDEDGDGSPPPVFTGARSLREDNGRG